MNGDAILENLNKQGLTFTHIADLLGVSVRTVSAVAHRQASSARVAIALSLAVGRPVHEVFPDRPRYHRPGPTVSARRLAEVRQGLAEAGVL